MKKLLFLVVVLFVMAGWTFAQTSNQPANNNQTGTSATSTQSNPGQTGAAATGNEAGTQTGTAATEPPAGKTKGKKGKLPQTASPLPLLGLLGVGSLGAGLVARKRR